MTHSQAKVGDRIEIKFCKSEAKIIDVVALHIGAFKKLVSKCHLVYRVAN